MRPPTAQTVVPAKLLRRPRLRLAPERAATRSEAAGRRGRKKRCSLGTDIAADWRDFRASTGTAIDSLISIMPRSLKKGIGQRMSHP